MVDWSNLEEVKDYHKNYYETHKEKLKANKRKYNETHKEERKAYRETHKEEIKAYNKNYHENHKEEHNATVRSYRTEHFVTKYHSYSGVVLCPKCGRTGYKSYYRNYNKKTGNYSQIITHVNHQHGKDGKTVYDGTCYIGMGKL